jgi:putative Holliday junction resolvase
MRYLGIDYGTKRTGLAISDDDGRLAVLKGTVQVASQDELISALAEIVAADEIGTVVVGLPTNLAGEPTEMTDQVTRFVEKLRNHLAVPVQTVDERLTTEMAKTLLRDVKDAERDQVAAQILLQNFLDGLARQ